MGTPGEACDTNDDRIMDVNLCDTAVANLVSTGALTSSTGAWGTQTTQGDNYVTGCSVKHTQDNMRHFNSKIHDVTRSSETPICKKACEASEGNFPVRILYSIALVFLTFDKGTANLSNFM